MKLNDQIYDKCYIADWFYIRTGRHITTPLGKKARQAFLKGKLVIIKRFETAFSVY